MISILVRGNGPKDAEACRAIATAIESFLLYKSGVSGRVEYDGDHIVATKAAMKRIVGNREIAIEDRYIE